MKIKTFLILVAVCGLVASTTEAQSPDSVDGSSTLKTASRFLFPPIPKSPEVHPNGTVTFRLRAPEANAVELVGEVLQGGPPKPMKKDEKGIWSITIGPLPPEIWIYNFRIEGVNFADPSNINLMPRAKGLAAVSNFVEVPGDEPADYDARPVPHGEVRMILYESQVMGVNRYVWVYTPPDMTKPTRSIRLLSSARQWRNPVRLGDKRAGEYNSR